MESTRWDSSGLTLGDKATSRALKAASSAEVASTSSLRGAALADGASAANAHSAVRAKMMTFEQKRWVNTLAILLDAAKTSDKENQIPGMLCLKSLIIREPSPEVLSMPRWPPKKDEKSIARRILTA